MDVEAWRKLRQPGERRELFRRCRHDSLFITSSRGDLVLGHNLVAVIEDGGYFRMKVGERNQFAVRLRHVQPLVVGDVGASGTLRLVSLGGRQSTANFIKSSTLWPAAKKSSKPTLVLFSPVKRVSFPEAGRAAG